MRSWSGGADQEELAKRSWPGEAGQEELARKSWPGGAGQEELAKRSWPGGAGQEELSSDCNILWAISGGGNRRADLHFTRYPASLGGTNRS